MPSVWTDFFSVYFPQPDKQPRTHDTCARHTAVVYTASASVHGMGNNTGAPGWPVCCLAVSEGLWEALDHLPPGATRPGGEVDRQHTASLFPILFKRNRGNIRNCVGIMCLVCVSVDRFKLHKLVQGKVVPRASVLGPQAVDSSQADECEGIDRPRFLRGLPAP